MELLAAIQKNALKRPKVKCGNGIAASTLFAAPMVLAASISVEKAVSRKMV